MENHDIHSVLNKWQRLALIIGVVAAVPCVMAGIGKNEHFAHLYLVAYLFWLGVSAGSLAWLCLHHMVGGRWGFMLQRLLEAAAKTLPLMALLYLPIAFRLGDIYSWVHPTPELEEIVAKKAFYLNVPFFLGRTAFYLVVWTAMAYALSRWSRKLDATGDQDIIRKIRVLAAPGLLIYAITASFASVDWLMSLEPGWWSTMYGPILMIGQGLSAMCMMAIFAHRLSRYKPFEDVVSQQHFHDIGNLMFAFVIFWTYINIAQYIIIWSGNIPEEDMFYLIRKTGGWLWVALALALLHFVVPFFLMLNKPVKRQSRILAKVAALVIVARFIDLNWQVTPNFQEVVTFNWLMLALPVAIGGIWMATFLQIFKRDPLLPEGDSRFKALHPSHAAHHG